MGRTWPSSQEHIKASAGVSQLGQGLTQQALYDWVPATRDRDYHLLCPRPQPQLPAWGHCAVSNHLSHPANTWRSCCAGAQLAALSWHGAGWNSHLVSNSRPCPPSPGSAWTTERDFECPNLTLSIPCLKPPTGSPLRSGRASAPRLMADSGLRARGEQWEGAAWMGDRRP